MQERKSAGAAPRMKRASQAWAAYNASYHVPDGEACRVIGRRLYQGIVREQIEAAFARGDRQDAELDRLLEESRSRATEDEGSAPAE